MGTLNLPTLALLSDFHGNPHGREICTPRRGHPNYRKHSQNREAKPNMPAFTITVQDPEVQAAFKSLAERVNAMASVLQTLGEGIVGRTKRRFDTSSAPDGTPGKPTAPPPWPCRAPAWPARAAIAERAAP